jgi:DNA helicase II / ATP-dependent DNA helicase PcrA
MTSAPDDIPACPPLPAASEPAPARTAAAPASPAPARPIPPRLVFFGVTGRRDLAQRAAVAAPGVRFTARRTWTEDPGEPHRPLLGGAPPVGLWLWSRTGEEFREQANAILLRLIHPLLARDLPYCLGFSFWPELLAPRGATVGDTSTLDLEDIGRLLEVTTGRENGESTPLGGAHRTTAARPALAAVSGPDAVRLDEAQRAAVLHECGPARVLAPAGSGKTKTLISRVVELVDRGCDPSGILMLAFNRKAAEQLEERLAALGIASTRRLGAPPDERGASRRRRPSRSSAPERPSGVHCATFNAFGYRYQREVMRARILLDHDGRALRELMARALVTTGISLRELQPRRGSDPVGAFVRALTRVRAALEPVEQVEVTLECVTETPLVTLPFAPVHAQYARAQAATGLQSFDDQIWFAVADMLADPVHRAFIQQRFDHVLVDEFQDLNGAQLALVDVLSRPHRRLFVVGDDDQLIYGWRQADPRGILEFHSRMPPKPYSATYTLCTNYRCSRAVVETGARLVANNKVREAKEIRPRAGAQDGAVRFFGAASWPRRAAALCAFLGEEKARMGCAWRDLAVLCRYRSQQLLVALALDAAGVPRTPALGCTLFMHPAAGLLRAYVDLAQAPDALHGATLAGLLNRPNRYVTAALAEAVGGSSEPWATVRAAAANEPAAGPRPLSALVELAGVLHDQLAGPVTSDELVWAVVEAFGLDGLWAAEADAAAASGASDGAGPLEVFDSLLLLAETYPDPGQYLATWDRLRADEEAHAGVADDTLAREESEEDRVVIGTIHAAKGREYHSVVIPDYDCDVSRWSAAEVEEERRVVYVGVTRARDAVLFTVDTSTGFVHPFLRELVEPPDPAEHESLSAWLEEETEAPGSSPAGASACLIADRLAEIEVLYPELAPQPPAEDAAASSPEAPEPPPLTAATAAAAAPAAPRSASPKAPCPASGSCARPPATPGP